MQCSYVQMQERKDYIPYTHLLYIQARYWTVDRETDNYRTLHTHTNTHTHTHTRTHTHTHHTTVPPDAPTNVMVGFPGTNTLSVSWTNGGNGNSPIAGVTIAFSATGDSGSQNFPGDASLQSATLMNLMPFRTYTVSVFVVNAIGRSEPRNNNGTTLSLRKSPPPCCYSTLLFHLFIVYLNCVTRSTPNFH